MKKLIAISAMALAAAVSVNAKTADELRVYINPGHGSWTPNDRPCTLVGHGEYKRVNTDTLSFFESNTNLRKGFGVLEALRAYGLKFDPSLNQTGERWQIGAARDLSQNIVMSHVKCGPYNSDNGTANQLGDATPADIYYYNRNLTEVCAEVTANNFDMFISIHSNAATEGTTTNYPLFLYGGWDTPKEGTGTVTLDRQTISRAMAQASWKYAFENPHSQWSYYSLTNQNVRGDMSFYGSTGTSGYLAALKHAAPGYLVEGYFHTYQPARHRAMNWDVCYVEGLAYAHGIADYFGLQKEKTGVIYGVVRDQHEKFKDEAYRPNPTSPDAYKPLNGVKVILKKDGQQVAEYTTDNYYNGAYVFGKLEPGKYTIEFDDAQYLPGEPLEVEVKANEVTYPVSSLVNVDWTPPVIVYENYPDVVVPGTYAADEYEFNQTYLDEPVAELEGVTIRRMLAKENNLYILAYNAEKTPVIIVYDAVAKKVVANVSIEGAQGSENAIGDIQLSADGVLVATNFTLNHFSAAQMLEGETRGVNRIYRWENDENGLPTGNPIEMGTSMLSGNMYRGYVGSSMAYSGTIADGKIVIPVYTAYESNNHKFFYNLYTILDGEIASATINNKVNESDLTLEVLGSDFSFSTSPLDDDKFIAVGSNGKVGQFSFNDVVNDVVLMPEGMLKEAGQASFFRYNKHAYMVTADNKDGKNYGVKVFDITNGLDKASLVGVVNKANAVTRSADATSVLPEAGKGVVAGSVVPVKDAEENVIGANINIFAMRDGKITRLTNEGVEVKASPVAMAYDLKAEADEKEEVYTLSFKSTQDVKNATIVLTPMSESLDEVRIEAGAVKKGENSVKVSAENIEPNENYNWAVELTSKTVPVTGEIKNEKNSLGVRGGVVNITDPTQESFGRTVVVYGKVNGFDVYDPEGNKIGEKLHKQHTNIASAFTNASDPFRGTQYNGYAVFPCWGDKASGVVMLNAAKPDEAPFSVFRNGKNDGTGNHVLEGVNLGGGCAGAAIVGEPDKAVLFTYSEDHEGKNGKGGSENAIVRYDLEGSLESPWAVTAAPKVLPSNGYKSMMANQSADLIPYGNGFFAVQNRGAGNNSASVPGFVYISAEDNLVKFNSADLEELNSVRHGLAITHDGKVLAVCSYTGVQIYDVTWDGDTPSMTFRYEFKGQTPVNYSQLSFDYAGNLYHFLPSNGFYVYALAQENPVVTTPANAFIAVKGESGVEDITVESVDNDAPVEFFNLNGVRVAADNLTPGLYIKRQGKKAEKVVIK